MKRNLSLGGAISRATRQQFNPFSGGQKSQRSFADTITQSIANQIVTPRNNRPGGELMRKGWGNNHSGMLQQEMMNTTIGGGRSRKPRS